MTHESADARLAMREAMLAHAREVVLGAPEASRLREDGVCTTFEQ